MADVVELKAALVAALSPLDGITWKRMFGCDAVFYNDVIFALVWKAGRLGLKYTEPEDFAERMAHSGSDRWSPGGRTTKHWILIPSSVAESTSQLSGWARIAHATVL
mgnify:FL=1